ncbi:MAG: hypothetical protein Aurels2KO_43630 [Aureliella sp.]
MRFVLIALIVIAASAAGNTASAQEPGWTGRVIKVGEDRARSDATPILQRPYRPLHFYGNTVRRRHYRGTALPNPGDLVQTAVNIFRR